jgi:hypothetical protein
VELTPSDRELIRTSLESVRQRLFAAAKELGFDAGNRELITGDYYIEVGGIGPDGRFHLFKIWIGDRPVENDIDFEISPRTGLGELDAVNWLQNLKKKWG